MTIEYAPSVGSKTYIHTLKCFKCTLEYMIFSMSKDWGIERTSFCPECGCTATGSIGTVMETILPNPSIFARLKEGKGVL